MEMLNITLTNHCKLVSYNGEGDKDNCDDLVSKISDVSINKEYDLKHLSPLIVVDKDWPKLLTSPIKTEVNRNFQGTGPLFKQFFKAQEPFSAIPVSIAEKTKRDIFSDYYKFNRNNHFVWTNQNVIKKGTEIDNRLIEKLKYKGDFNYKNCNLKNPGKTFELRPTDKFGLGLYAKHNIPKGSFSLIFIS